MIRREPRQLNVQQQNTKTLDGIRREATYWRAHGVPEPLRRAGEERGVDWKRSIVIDMEVDFPGMPALFGLVLDQDERFIRFEIDTVGDLTVDEWKDVTASQNCNEHNRGIGVGDGALALRILHELNEAESKPADW